MNNEESSNNVSNILMDKDFIAEFNELFDDYEEIGDILNDYLRTISNLKKSPEITKLTKDLVSLVKDLKGINEEEVGKGRRTKVRINEFKDTHQESISAIRY